MPISLLLADDHPAFRAGLRAHLEREPDLDVVAEAGTAAEALALVARHAPDVLVLDMELPDLSGLDVAERLAAEGSETAVLVLSAFEDETYIFGVLDAGAAGYLSKQEPLDAIAEAVRGTARGDVGWLSRRIGALYLQRHRRGRAREARQSETERTLAALSPRELDVLPLVARGLSNGDIADQLFLSESTVKKHVHAIYDKTQRTTRPQLVAWAWRSGLMEDDEEEA